MITHRQKDFLGQLISVMCESNEVGRLNTLGFVGFQQEVEAILSFKARNSDPLRFPNYYKVLYSWHISRGDYRSGKWLVSPHPESKMTRSQLARSCTVKVRDSGKHQAVRYLLSNWRRCKEEAILRRSMLCRLLIRGMRGCRSGERRVKR